MSPLASLVAAASLLAGVAGEAPVAVVHAPDSPVRIDRATFLTTTDAPPVILYSATNQLPNEVDQFTVIVFVFDDQGTLKARQTAPARRLLEVGETKYSSIVVDGWPIEPTDQLVIGVNQVQLVGSSEWWRADVQPAAEAAVQAHEP